MYLNGGVSAGMIIKLPPGGVKDRRVHKDIQMQEGFFLGGRRRLKQLPAWASDFRPAEAVYRLGSLVFCARAA